MPLMTGHQVAEQIKILKEQGLVQKELKVVMITGDSVPPPQTRQNNLMYGGLLMPPTKKQSQVLSHLVKTFQHVDKYFQKPVNFTDITQYLNQIIATPTNGENRLGRGEVPLTNVIVEESIKSEYGHESSQGVIN
ncbi:hypothetical protein FGO68_gene15756 [Halteria grandinella]|uniref:Uncharacterized protein n=1 Tax=Halteria grandinella TaxID=5974 RepID=A0A8J8P661_HALGN|nr:hypothetical protein FGO68_gene15756 [Halteria grandinella]